MKRYMNVPDERPLDEWGKPVGKTYEKKDWEQLTPEEMMLDFEWKSDVLDSYGEEVSSATFYQDYLFRELFNEELPGDYKVLLTEYDADEGNKVHKIDVEDIQDYLHLNDVALSPCLFYGNWRRKKLLNYVSAFVLDIDKLRPTQLQRFMMLFEEGRLLRPTFIANSGSGVHFYYMLDKMLQVDSGYHEGNNQISDAIYKALYDDVIKKEKWKDAQRHWIGQDYRVVNSRTKLNLKSQIFKVGELYAIEELIKHYEIRIDPKKHYASKSMVKYAGNIAKELKIDPPDYSNAKETYAFIKANKDAAFEVREQRREARQERQKKKVAKKPVTWYKNTLAYMFDHTQAGYRFGSMKALAVIAFKEKVPREIFLQDLKMLAAYWENQDWKGDKFNNKNVVDIERFFDNASKYSNTSAETLEEWLGYSFKRIGNKRNGRNQKEHLGRARAVQNFDDPEGKWRNKDGRPSAEQIVREWRQTHPDARKADCIRETGLDKKTVYKWWNGNTDKEKAKQNPKPKKVQEPVPKLEDQEVDLTSQLPIT